MYACIKLLLYCASDVNITFEDTRSPNIISPAKICIKAYSPNDCKCKSLSVMKIYINATYGYVSEKEL